MDEKTKKLVEENNELLHKMQNAQTRGKIYRIIRWIIILALAIAAFYFVQPYIEQVQNTYDSLNEMRESAEQGGFSEEDISRLFDTVR